MLQLWLLPEHQSKEMTLLLTSRKPSGYCGLPELDSDTQGLTKPVEPHTLTPMACYSWVASINQIRSVGCWVVTFVYLRGWQKMDPLGPVPQQEPEPGRFGVCSWVPNSIFPLSCCFSPARNWVCLPAGILKYLIAGVHNGHYLTVTWAEGSLLSSLHCKHLNHLHFPTVRSADFFHSD